MSNNKIHKAERRAVPGLIGIAGPSGSGKTFSALLLAAGLCPEGKRIGLIDTEKGRGEHYADNPIIKANLPDGYDAMQLDEPFSPDRYVKAIEEFRKAGNYGVVIIDSATHEWEGFGGCQDIAENNKLGGVSNWALAKKEHKRFMRKGTTMPFHVISCIRAQEKTSVNRVGGKMVFTDLGMQPVQEKNFKYEMLIACMLDPKTKHPVMDSDFHKVPDDLQGLFQGGRFITKQDGVKLREWISGGKYVDGHLRVLQGEFRTASNNGMKALLTYWKSISKDNKIMLEPIKDECKAIASEADRQTEENNEDTPVPTREIEKPSVTPNGKSNEKAPKPKEVREEKKVAPKTRESAKVEVLASDTPEHGSAKPSGTPIQMQEDDAKPDQKSISKSTVANDTGTHNAIDIVEEDEIPVEEDEATRTANEIAATLTAEVEEDEIPVEEDEIPNEDVPPPAEVPDEPAVEEEEEELDLL